MFVGGFNNVRRYHIGIFQGTLGHEFVGRVIRLPVTTSPVPEAIKIGDRVVGEINLACNKCEVCEQGGIAKRNHCPARTVLGIVNKDGTFAEYVTLPLSNLYRVPDGLSTSSAAFAEPLAAAFRVREQIDLKMSDSVAIIGDGKLGLLITDVVKRHPHAPKRVAIFGHHADKMALTAEGVERVILDGHNKDKFMNMFDVTIEASGTPSGVMQAADLTRPLGTIVLKTTCAADNSSFNTAPFVVKEIALLGSRCGNFKMALTAMAIGQIEVTKYITKTYPFHQAEEAIAHAGRKGTLKIQLLMTTADD